MPTSPDLVCFKGQLMKPCKCFSLEPKHIVQQIETGGARCEKCNARIDFREAFSRFPVLGQPEALFGLDVWTLTKKIPSTANSQIIVVDPGLSLPYEGEIVYANVTPNSVPDEAPLLLAPQESHYAWPLHMHFHVPPGGERAISLMLVVKPREALELPRELALQAVQVFHRRQYNIAAVLLAASVEAALRRVIAGVYKEKQVAMPADLGLASLVERARLFFAPTLGVQLVGHLKELAREGRNPAAHGESTELDEGKIARWMVDAASVFEWSRWAKSLIGDASSA